MNLFARRADEFNDKLRRLRERMEPIGIENLLITQTHNFSWLTCGGENFVFLAQNAGSAPLLVTPDRVFCTSNNIEAPRLFNEEIAQLPIENAEHPWYATPQEIDAHLSRLTSGHIIKDTEVENELKSLRDSLYPDEIERYRLLALLAEEAIRTVAHNIKPGMSEYEAASILSREMLKRNIWPVVLLVAADERANHYRHPLPTDKKIDNYCMLVLGARRYGLHISITRCVSFKPLDDELRRKHEAVCQVDAMLYTGCRVGAVYGEVLRKGIEIYEHFGFGEEWKKHHQGGPTGYLGRTLKVTPQTTDRIQLHQVIAWNPSISGTKSEDTIIIQEQGFEIITNARDWPMVGVRIGEQIIDRSDILVRKP